MGVIYKKYTGRKCEIFVVIYILHIIRFYYFLPYTFLHNILNAIDILYAFFFAFCFIKYKSRTTITKLEVATAILYVVFLLSVFIGIKNGQQIDRVLKYTSMVFLQFGFYYYLRLHNVSTEFLLKLLKHLLIGYVVITVLCYLQYPNCWFGGDDEQSLARMKSSLEDRGLIRFTLPCKMLVPLFLFMEIQNLGLWVNNKMKIFILFILLLFIGNRFPLVISLLVIGYMIAVSNNIKFFRKIQTGVVVAAVIAMLSFVSVTRNIIDSLIQTTVNERDAGDENNIRVLAATYFFLEFNGDKLEPKIIGNGIASNGDDMYSKEMKYLNEEVGFWESDVGYCEIYIYFGIVGLLGLFFWCYGVYDIKIEESYKYIKYYFLFLMVSMICGGYWFENIYVANILTYTLVKSNENLMNKYLCVKLQS